jgi:hypothetical protein
VRVAPQPQPQQPARPAVPAPMVFETPIPSDVQPPLEAAAVLETAEGEGTLDERIWDESPEAGQEMPGEPVFEDLSAWLAEAVAVVTGETAADATGGDGAPETFEGGWSAVRDANIRPYADWRPPQVISLPAMATPSRGASHPAPGGSFSKGPGPNGHNGGSPRAAAHPGNKGNNGNNNGAAPGGNGRGKRRRRGRDRTRPPREGGGGGGDRHRDRGPRLPGFYNPGGD